MDLRLIVSQHFGLKPLPQLGEPRFSTGLAMAALTRATTVRRFFASILIVVVEAGGSMLKGWLKAWVN